MTTYRSFREKQDLELEDGRCSSPKVACINPIVVSRLHCDFKPIQFHNQCQSRLGSSTWDEPNCGHLCETEAQREQAEFISFIQTTAGIWMQCKIGIDSMKIHEPAPINQHKISTKLASIWMLHSLEWSSYAGLVVSVKMASSLHNAHHKK